MTATAMMFQTTGAYRGTIDGQRIDVQPGDVLDLPLTALAPLLRDVPGLVDPRQPLSTEDADRIRAERHQATVAAVEEERAGHAAVQNWVRRWDTLGPQCPGHPGRGRHDAETRDLTARRIDAGWIIACPAHIDALADLGEIPPSPKPVDRSVSTYRVLRRYAASWVEYAPRGALSGSSTPAPILRLDFEPGQRYALRADIAAWVERDSPGVLVREGEE